MKILLFNLGSISSRINAWGIDGFQPIFEQDVILWGPVHDKEFIYNGKKIHILRISEETSIKNVFERLPEDWYPDIVTCDTSVLNFVPDIYLCPVKTILFTRDSWADTIYNRGLVEFFDFIDYGIVDRSFYNKYNVNILPLKNCSVALPDNNPVLPEFRKREIDVISISNYNAGFYHDRYKALYKASELSACGIKIKYFTGISRKEINKYYLRSKMVLDWAHTLSNRSYEAALNKCLLFSHEDNPVIKEFWVPWEEYIPYNENNLTELIQYYLNNQEISQKIVERAHEKVKKMPLSMGQSQWQQICLAYNTQIDTRERIRRIKTIPRGELLFRASTPFVYNYNFHTKYPDNWTEIYFQRINNAISYTTKDDLKIPPLIEAARVAFLVNNFDLSEKYLTDLERIEPDYAWIWYLRARQLYLKRDFDQVLLMLRKATDSAKKAPDLLKKYLLPLIEKDNSCDGRRITNYLWQPVYMHENDIQVNSLLHLSWELSGDVFFARGELNDSIKAYSEALESIFIPECFDKLFRTIAVSEPVDFMKMREFLETGLMDSPYYSRLVLYSAYVMFQNNQKVNGLRLLRDHRNALKCFSGKRNIIFIRRSITFILFIKLFGKRFISKMIKALIRFLDSRKKG